MFDWIRITKKFYKDLNDDNEWDNQWFKYYAFKGWALVGKLTTKGLLEQGDFIMFGLQTNIDEKILRAAKIDIVSQITTGNASVNYTLTTKTGIATMTEKTFLTDKTATLAGETEVKCPDAFGTHMCNGLREVYGQQWSAYVPSDGTNKEVYGVYTVWLWLPDMD